MSRKFGLAFVTLWAGVLFLPAVIFAADLPTLVELQERLAAQQAEIARLQDIAVAEEAHIAAAERLVALRRIAKENIIWKKSNDRKLEEQIGLEMAKILIHDPSIAAGERLPVPINVSYSLYGPGSTGGGGKTVFKANNVIITSMIGDRETLLRDCAPHEAAHALHVRLCGRINVARWINEGLATLEERPESIKRLVYDKLDDRPLPQLSELVAIKDYPRDIELFYAHGTAFSAFILSRLHDAMPNVSDRGNRVTALGFSLAIDDKDFGNALKQYKAQLGMQGWKDDDLRGGDLIARTEQEFREWLYQKTKK